MYSVRENEIVLVAPAAPHKNIRRVGEEFAAGSTCLRAKQKLTPPTVALLASLGMESVRVHSAPRIALVITGSELVEPGQALGPAKIYNSNRYGIEAALADIGLSVTSLFITADHENELRDTLRNAVQQADVILTSGGVSVGDVDYVKPALLSLGATIHFDKVAIKPGKPFVFATLDEKFFFGLPGNPVSALVTYLLFVKPALVKMLGSRSFLPSHRTASLGCDVQKRNPRTEFVRGRFADDTGNTIEPCRGQESHMLGGLASADAMIVLEGEPRMLRMGEEVEVMPISWS
jgi:molybdopterin molybdotransferase